VKLGRKVKDTEQLGSLSVAIGTRDRGLAAMRAINLLPRDDYFKRRQKQQKVQWVVVVPVILVVLISGVLSMLFLSASSNVKDRKAELAT
jgi:hypothetical protein